MSPRRIPTGVHGPVLLPAIGTMAAFSVGVALLPASIALLPAAVGTSLLAVRVRRGFPPTIAGVAGQTAADVVKGPRFQLVAMPINHYGEKLRWALDLVGADYEESSVSGLLSVYLRGRTVPWLVDRHSASLIGNSDEALAYIGAVCIPHLDAPARARAEALFARSPLTNEWDVRLRDLGHAVQGWAYRHLLDPAADGEPSLRYWGGFEPAVPPAQRAFLRATAPGLKRAMRFAFRLDDEAVYAERRATIDACLDAADAALAEHPFLTGDTLSYVDLGFCALLAPLLGSRIVAGEWARGRFASFRAFEDDAGAPEPLREFEESFAARPAGQHVVRTYAEWRGRSLAG